MDIVLETDNFRVYQDYALPIPGMMIIELKRHVRSMINFTFGESNELVSVFIRTREAMRNVGIVEAVLVQEERSTRFHACKFWQLQHFSLCYCGGVPHII